MTEEIKEILNNLRYTAKEHTIQVLENGGMIEHCPQQIPTEMRLNSYSAKILLDYITNLQQENERLKEKINNLEMFKYNIPNDKTKTVPTMIKSYKNEYEDYKSRCEKAIKDIDLLMTGNYEVCGTIYMQSSCCNKRLEIIKKNLIGSDENETK